MYSTSDFRKGLYIEMEGIPYVIIESQFVKPGKGNAFTRVKIKNLLNKNLLDKTFKSGGKVSPANVEKKEMQFLYKEQNSYCFMDIVSYEQISLVEAVIDPVHKWLQENVNVHIIFHNGNPIDLELPNAVIQKVTYSEPGYKGNKINNPTKAVTLENGVSINVPLFIDTGDKIKVNTTTGEYIERAK